MTAGPMTADENAAAALLGGVALLERAINYTFGSLRLVTAPALVHPTPCRDWNLGALLDHMNDSLAALYEAVTIGRVEPYPADPEMPVDDPVEPVAALRDRARRLLGAWSGASDSRQTISVFGSPLTAGIVTSTGAIEIAVHGWDVAEACGRSRPLPAALAEELLELVPLFVTGRDRPVRFAAPVEVSPLADPGDRLVAFLGRKIRQTGY
jgi:uncharacterized protein (TIGR03086 family)